MRLRLFKTKMMESKEPVEPVTHQLLKDRDVIAEQISDHRPVVHNKALFWNVMMRGGMLRNKSGYNNAFKLDESEADYLKRLAKVAHVIAEIIYFQPDIEKIGLCEGPIESSHVKFFLKSLHQFVWMQKYLKNFYKPNLSSDNYGLLLLTDKKYHVSEIDGFNNTFPELNNRMQLWKLTHGSTTEYFALAHLPIGKDVYLTQRDLLSGKSLQYGELIASILNHYESESLTFCADVNMIPFLISEYQDRVLDRIPMHNSVMHTSIGETPATVDVIALSKLEKQKNYVPWLFKSISHNRDEEKSSNIRLLSKL
jgi:hypothetical protein